MDDLGTRLPYTRILLEAAVTDQVRLRGRSDSRGWRRRLTRGGRPGDLRDLHDWMQLDDVLRAADLPVIEVEERDAFDQHLRRVVEEAELVVGVEGTYAFAVLEAGDHGAEGLADISQGR